MALGLADAASRRLQPRYQEGFTLIEMMIVVAIIAILVSILVPNFVRARAQGQTSACESNLKEIATALELFQTDNDHYPSSGTVNSNNAELSPYLKQTPVDPAGGPAPAPVVAAAPEPPVAVNDRPRVQHYSCHLRCRLILLRRLLLLPDQCYGDVCVD